MSRIHFGAYIEVPRLLVRATWKVNKCSSESCTNSKVACRGNFCNRCGSPLVEKDEDIGGTPINPAYGVIKKEDAMYVAWAAEDTYTLLSNRSESGCSVQEYLEWNNYGNREVKDPIDPQTYINNMMTYHEAEIEDLIQYYGKDKVKIAFGFVEEDE